MQVHELQLADVFSGGETYKSVHGPGVLDDFGRSDGRLFGLRSLAHVVHLVHEQQQPSLGGLVHSCRGHRDARSQMIEPQMEEQDIRGGNPHLPLRYDRYLG